MPNQIGEIDRLRGDLEMSGLGPRQLVQIVDERERTAHAAPHPRDALVLFGGQRSVHPFAQEFGVAVCRSDGVLDVVTEAAHQP